MEDSYDKKELKRLWKLNYRDLAEAPGEPNGRLREARFIMEVRSAAETRRNNTIITVATIVMSIATIVMSIATVIMAA